jgi:hypothetical protein
VTFTLDQASTFALSGSMTGTGGGMTTLTFTGPSGPIASLVANADQEMVVVSVDGEATAGTYTFEIRCGAGAGASDGTSSSSAASYDVDLNFDGAVDAPLVAAPSIAPRATPNPFRATTRIETATPHDVPVRVDVFDVVGRHVRTLGPTTGSTLEWDGRSSSGRAVPAGAYFARVTSSLHTSVMKVSVVR